MNECERCNQVQFPSVPTRSCVPAQLHLWPAEWGAYSKRSLNIIRLGWTSSQSDELQVLFVHTKFSQTIQWVWPTCSARLTEFLMGTQSCSIVGSLVCGRCELAIKQSSILHLETIRSNTMAALHHRPSTTREGTVKLMTPMILSMVKLWPHSFHFHLNRFFQPPSFITKVSIRNLMCCKCAIVNNWKWTCSAFGVTLRTV